MSFVIYILVLADKSLDDSITLYGINKKMLVKTTFGNLGRTAYTCANGQSDEILALNCLDGTIGSLISFGVSKDNLTCSSGPNLEIGFQCNDTGDFAKNYIINKFNYCSGKNSCDLNLNSEIIQDCISENSYLFINALCDHDKVDMNFGSFNFEITKLRVAIISVILDLFCILLFAVGTEMYFQ